MPTEKKSPLPLIAIIAASTMVIALPVAIWLGTRPANRGQEMWERTTYGQVVRLKAEAEKLAIAGKLAESHAKYREIDTLVAGRQIKDPQFFDTLEQAKTDKDRVYAILLKKMERTSFPAVAVPQPPLSAVQIKPAVSPALPATEPTVAKEYPQAYRPFERAPSASLTTNSPTTSTTSVSDTDPARPRGLNGATTGSDLAARRGPRPIPIDLISDDAIGASINRAVDFLLLNFQNDELQNVKGSSNSVDQAGLNALCVYALLQASLATHDPRIDIHGDLMKRLIERMKKHPMTTDATTQAPVVYARSLRVAALAVFNRPEDRVVMKADVEYLTRVPVNGAYTYDDRFNRQTPGGSKQQPPPLAPPAPTPFGQPEAAPPAGSDARPIRRNPWLDGIESPNLQILADGKHNPDGSEGDPNPVSPQHEYVPPMVVESHKPQPAEQATPWDNSNSQYGLLGVWMGAESGLEVPTKYWQQVDMHWTNCQVENGQWTYNPTTIQPSYSMTVAGIASLFVTHDYLDPGLQKKRSRDPFSLPLAKGLAWLEIGDNSVTLLGWGTHYVSYNLYGLERVGLASGFKYFGRHDWYRELAARVIPVQWPNGAFGRQSDGYDAVLETAFTTLFLSRGRHPIIMSKLRFDGYWANQPRDIANVARYMSRQLERPLNWQVVPISHDWPDWTDSPILYIASDEPPAFSDEQIARLRGFAQAGGLIFTHSDGGSAKFNDFIEKTLAPKLFPQYEIKEIPSSDVIFTAQFQLKNPLPKLRGVWNGARWLLVHSPADLAANWQTRNEKMGRNAFDLAENLFLYAAGKTDLRNRLSSNYIPAPQENPTFRVKIARLKYAGNWDPEPYAWTRFDRWMQWQCDTALDVEPVEISNLKSSTPDLAVLTGANTYSPGDDEIAALKSFVEAGGWLLIDSCGSGEFSTSIETAWLPKLAAGKQFEPLPATDPILAGGGPWNLDNLTKPLYRPLTIDRFGANGAKLRALTLGKGRILYSPIDITSGLLGTNTLGILGYQSSTACSVVKNVVIAEQAAK